jgi:hypothetical protein
MKKRLLLAVSLAALGTSAFSQSSYNYGYLMNIGYAPNFENSFGIQFGRMDLDTGSWINSCISSIDYAGYHYKQSYNELLISGLLGPHIAGVFHLLIGGGLGVGWGDLDSNETGGNVEFAWKVSGGTALTLGPVLVDAVCSYGGHLGWQFYVGFGVMFKSQPGPSYSYTPPPPQPPQGDSSGTIYYSYNGTGYVYLSESVFYLCSSGKPVGYVEGGTIYAFNGRVLGFYENAFIYNRNGNPVGANDSKRLGTDASARKSVTKANKQDIPEKQPKNSVPRPRLKNGYFGGSLLDIF